MTATIKTLKVRDFKRVRLVEITPDGRVVELRGKNAQGKSSVLDAIQAAVGGKRAVPDKPLRRGATDGEVTLTLTDGTTIKLRINEAGDTSVRLQRDGVEIKKPQDQLNALFNGLSFDPLAFTTMEPKRQAEQLRNLLGLDFSKVDGKRAALYADRTDVNRDLERAKARLAAVPADYAPNLPEQEVSVSGLLAERKSMETAAAEYDARVRDISEVDRAITGAVKLVESAQTALREAEHRLEDLRKIRASAVSDLEVMTRPNTSHLDEQIERAEDTNRQIRQRAQRRALEADVNTFREGAERMTRDIETIDRWKAEKIASAKMPVDGLGFSEDGVTFDGLPFAQASRAQQIRVSVAMGLAMNPELRVMLIRDGSVLDDESRAVLAQLAEEFDAQLWIEIVDDDGADGGIVIEDGVVRRRKDSAGGDQ